MSTVIYGRYEGDNKPYVSVTRHAGKNKSFTYTLLINDHGVGQ